jgi:predicted dehydrogenase
MLDANSSPLLHWRKQISGGRGVSERKIKLGLIGGGKGSMIGDIHRLAALHTGRFELVAGALATTKARADASAEAAGIPLDRSYENFETMAAVEAARPDGVEAVAILTPNAFHAPAAQAFLKNGCHIICEKPMTGTLAEAETLARTVTAANAAFILAHSYTAFAMIRRAHAIIRTGDLGAIRVIHSAYLQDGHIAFEQDPASTNWHLDPARSGIAGTLGDVGSHAFHMTTWLTGLTPEAVTADLSAFGPHTRLDNDGNALLRFKGGAKATISFSQMAIGKGNGFTVYVYGDKGALAWSVETPNELHLTRLGEPTKTLTPDEHERAEDAHWESIGFGSFAPYASAFTRLYSEAAEQIDARREHRAPAPAALLAPDIDDGLTVMKFIDAAVRSSKPGAGWVTL